MNCNNKSLFKRKLPKDLDCLGFGYIRENAHQSVPLSLVQYVCIYTLSPSSKLQLNNLDFATDVNSRIPSLMNLYFSTIYTAIQAQLPSPSITFSLSLLLLLLKIEIYPFTNITIFIL